MPRGDRRRRDRSGEFTLLRLVSGAAVLFLLAGARMPELPRGRANFLSALPLALYAIAFAFAYVRLSAGTGALILFGASSSRC